MYVPWKMLLADFLMEIYSVTPISLCQVLMIYWRICVCNVHAHEYIITTLNLVRVAYLNLIHMTPGFQCQNILLMLHLICEYIDFGLPSAMGGFSIFNWFFEVITFALCFTRGNIIEPRMQSLLHNWSSFCIIIIIMINLVASTYDTTSGYIVETLDLHSA